NSPRALGPWILRRYILGLPSNSSDFGRVRAPRLGSPDRIGSWCAASREPPPVLDMNLRLPLFPASPLDVPDRAPSLEVNGRDGPESPGARSQAAVIGGVRPPAAGARRAAPLPRLRDVRARGGRV